MWVVWRAKAKERRRPCLRLEEYMEAENGGEK